jgi:hypothetical protein
LHYELASTGTIHRLFGLLTCILNVADHPERRLSNLAVNGSAETGNSKNTSSSTQLVEYRF